MASDRSGDIARVKRDLERLDNAQDKVGEMLRENVTLTEDLNDLDVAYRSSVKIPQYNFRTVMMDLNGQIGTKSQSISGKIAMLVVKLQALLERLEAEQREWEEEQRKAAEEAAAAQQDG